MNLGTQTHGAIKAKVWSEVMETMVRESSINLTHQDIMSIHETKREGNREGPKPHT